MKIKKNMGSNEVFYMKPYKTNFDSKKAVEEKP